MSILLTQQCRSTLAKRELFLTISIQPSGDFVCEAKLTLSMVSRPFCRYHCRHWNISTFSYSVAGCVITDYDKTFQFEKSRF